MAVETSSGTTDTVTVTASTEGEGAFALEVPATKVLSDATA